MFGSTSPLVEHPGGAVRFALLRATDLTIAALTLESYSLADVAPGAAAELSGAEARRGHLRQADRLRMDESCFARTHEPSPARRQRAGAAPSVAYRAQLLCTTPAAHSPPACRATAPAHRNH